MDLFFNPNQVRQAPPVFLYGSQPPWARNMVSLSICQVSICRCTYMKSFSKRMQWVSYYVCLHSPITIIAIWRGSDTKHTMPEAVKTMKENERRYLLWRQTEMTKKYIMPGLSYVLPGKRRRLPARIPCGRYFTVSRPLLLLCFVWSTSCQLT